MTDAKPSSSRRETIIAAARRCFVRFGYAKTSFADVAKSAGISRPLIYLHFKSKDELLGAVFTSVFEERYPAVERILAAAGTPSAKLTRIYDQLLVEPWAEVIGGAASDEFFATCEQIIPEAAAAYEKRRLRYTTAVLGDRELAQIFAMSADGLLVDLPSS
ncbi:MAG: TetR/AcrR family transcriptional regulator, partial [Candidatus Eremiobacteraeota bacterium]|nr:TetR/AcrR family transcriptional regulator [Candidatus Eremiobacteraeota bacterium]